MIFHGKTDDEICEEIKKLVENSEPESTTLEYKEQLPGKTDQEKKEFLADVSSFANQNGGVIIYGIKEKRDESGHHTGEPEEIVDLNIGNPEKKCHSLESIIRSGLEPKLNNFYIKVIKIDGASVLIVDIPRSLLSPHTIWFKHSGKFYLRSSRGKEQMDVHEIRAAFLQSEGWEKEADNFRRTRIMESLYQPILPNLDNEFSYYIHILPLGTNRRIFDLQILNKNSEIFKSMSSFGTWQSAYNLDGALIYIGHSRIICYIQFFRNGGLEFFISTPRKIGQAEGKEVWTFIGQLIEKYAVDFLHNFIRHANILEMESPFVVFLTLTNLKDKYIFDNPDWIQHMGSNYRHFDRDQILVPGVVINDISSSPIDILEPTLDMIWQAGGWLESPVKARREIDKKKNN